MYNCKNKRKPDYSSKVKELEPYMTRGFGCLPMKPAG